MLSQICDDAVVDAVENAKKVVEPVMFDSTYFSFQ